MQKEKEWFGEWFSSPYYHVLYKHRDIDEARKFIDNLIQHLRLKQGDKIMDLACGKGRHAMYLNQKGFDVVGLDLSAANINEAKRHSSVSLKFQEHDMRHLYAEGEFDYVFNMFTSFGYFDSLEENQQVITNISQSLVKGGKLVLDFLNPDKVINSLTPEEVKICEGIEFHITREVNNNYIVKTVKFNHEKEDYTFLEKVRAFKESDFRHFFERAGLEVQHLFGDYELNDYDNHHSDRMIFIVSK